MTTEFLRTTATRAGFALQAAALILSGVGLLVLLTPRFPSVIHVPIAIVCVVVDAVAITSQRPLVWFGVFLAKVVAVFMAGMILITGSAYVAPTPGALDWRLGVDLYSLGFGPTLLGAILRWAGRAR